MSEVQDHEFKYHIAGNELVVILFLVGDMNSKSALAVKDCMDDLLSRKEIKAVVVSFSGVTQVSGDALQLLAQMQIALRSRSARLRLCGMKAEQKEKLGRAGIIRLDELRNSVKEGIASLSNTSKTSVA